MNRDEKRIFDRLEERINLKYRIIKPTLEEKQYFVTTKDISAGGLSFISEKPIPSDAILELEIEMWDSPNPIKCLGKVVRMAKFQENNEEFYNIGVLFLDLSPADRTRIIKYAEGK